MAETHMGLWGALRAVVRSTSAGFILAELVLESASTPIGPLPAVVAQVTGVVGVAGLGAVSLCLAFAAGLISLATGLLVGGRAMRLLGGAAGTGTAEVAAGIAVVTGAVANGTLAGLLPTWMYLLLQCIVVLTAYPFPRANEMTAGLSVIFIFLFLSVVFGSLGVFSGLVAMGISIATVCAALKALSERRTQDTRGRSRHWSERLLLYSVVVAVMGFSVGLGSGDGPGAGEGVMLRSVLWVGLLSAVLMGGALGTVVVVGLKPAGAERVALGAVLASSATLTLILPACTTGGVGGLLGGATAAGVLLGTAGVASETEFKTRKMTLLVVASVAVGVFLGSLELSPRLYPGLSLLELTAVMLVALGAFILGAPKSPFHTQVKLHGDILTGPALMEGVGMEAISAATAPLGVGALGAAGLGTVAMGTLGAMGVLGAAGLALGKTLEAAARGEVMGLGEGEGLGEGGGGGGDGDRRGLG